MASQPNHPTYPSQPGQPNYGWSVPVDQGAWQIFCFSTFPKAAPFSNGQAMDGNFNF